MKRLIVRYGAKSFEILKPYIKEAGKTLILEGGTILIDVGVRNLLDIISKYKNKIGQIKYDENNNRILLYPINDGEELFKLVSNYSVSKQEEENKCIDEIKDIINKFNNEFESKEENKITNFRGKYLFLSSFYICPIEYKEIKYNTSETAFQAMKFDDEEIRRKVAQLTPREANKLGKMVSLKENWHKIKEDIMYDITLCKFKQNRDLAQLLLNTADKELIQENDWNDIEWGVVNGVGKNKLGKILMRVREQIKNDIEQ